MLKTQLLHPQILEALGRAGHNSKVLIADGNYPSSTKLGPRATLVSLNLSPGVVDAVTVLRALAGAVPIEAAAVMETFKTGPYAMKKDPPIWRDFRRVLDKAGFKRDFERIAPDEFYMAASTPDVALTIVTAEQRIYANLLLTIGVVMP